MTTRENILPLREMSEAQTRLTRRPFCILGWTVNASTGRIHCGDKEVKLEPKVMDVLVFLASRPQEVVTRAELEDNVWAQVVVSYETLTSTIQKLRKAFNDDARDPRVIETLSKRGYRFIAPVSWPDNEEDGLQSSDVVDAPKMPTSRRRPMFLGALLVSALIIGLGSYWYSTRSSPPPGNEARMEKSTPPADSAAPPSLPDKLSIVVLPFKNMSADPEQGYFSDGLTEDLITDLSKISALTVIARASTLAYKDVSPDIRAVAKALNVRYVVEGSVRKAGGKVRITAQLIEAETGKHLWAERYDRDLKDIFALQDEVRKKIVSALAVKLTPDEERRLARPLTTSTEAYILYLKGLQQESFFTRDSNLESRKLFEAAIELDPGFASAFAHLAQAFTTAVASGWSVDKAADRKQALTLAEKAVDLDSELSYGRWSLGRVLVRQNMNDRAFAETKKAIELNPNYANAFAIMTSMYLRAGRAEDGLESIKKAMRMNPDYPFLYLYTFAMAHFALERFEVSAVSLEKALERNPNVTWLRILLAAAYAKMGNQDDAQWQVEELRGLGFNKSLDEIVEDSHFRFPAYKKLFIDGLRKAGFK